MLKQAVFVFLCGFVLLIHLKPMAGPVVAVPWNGHPGAVTFSFDDGLQSDIVLGVPVLDSRGVKGTFFLCQWCGPADSLAFAYKGNRAPWLAAAKSGHELANHSMTHPGNFLSMDSAQVEHEVSDWADSLRRMSPYIDAVTFAYPSGNKNPLIEKVVNEQNIIARDGGSPLMRYNQEPANWMEAPGWELDTTVRSVMSQTRTEFDLAAQDSSWVMAYSHGISGQILYIQADSLGVLIDYALSKKLWVATYEKIAAYWRAQLAMNAVAPTVKSYGWDISWTSPHPRMPASVPLRFKLTKSYFGDTVTVYQNGVKILPETDGSCVIDFMKLRMTVYKGNVTYVVRPSPKNGFSPPVFSGADGGRLEIYDMAGALLGVVSTHQDAVSMLRTKTKGVYFVKSRIGPVARWVLFK